MELLIFHGQYAEKNVIHHVYRIQNDWKKHIKTPKENPFLLSIEETYALNKTDWICCQNIDWLIDWLLFNVQRAIFQQYSGRVIQNIIPINGNIIAYVTT